VRQSISDIGAKRNRGAHFNSFQPQYILHIVQSGMLANEPMRRLQSALSEVLAAQRTMGQFNALTQACEEYGMFAYNIAAADRVHSNLALCPLADVAFASMTNTPLILELAATRYNLRQPPRCTTRRVFFPTMVKLQNFDVKARPQHPVGFLGQPE